MKVGIIAEGPADVEVIRAVLATLVKLDRSDTISIRPDEQRDNTDLNERNFSNWTLVLEECRREGTLSKFFDFVDEERYLIVQIDTAERGEVGYGVSVPQRTGNVDWKLYSSELRANVIRKIETTIGEKYRERLLYAVCIEETDAWLIPLFEISKKDTASKVRPKEYLQGMIGKLKDKHKYIDADKKNLNYTVVGKLLKKKLNLCRVGNESLNLFCIDLEKSLVKNN